MVRHGSEPGPTPAVILQIPRLTSGRSLALRKDFGNSKIEMVLDDEKSEIENLKNVDFGAKFKIFLNFQSTDPQKFETARCSNGLSCWVV